MKRQRDSIDDADDVVSREHQRQIRDNIFEQYSRKERCDVTLIAGDDEKRFVNCIKLLAKLNYYFKMLKLAFFTA